jgi:hypothetical protein
MIERKIREEFKTMLGPLGIGEFNELKSKNALNREDIFRYVDSLTQQYIIDQTRGMDFKDRIGNIFGDEKDVINREIDTPHDNLGDEVLKRD